MGIIITHKIDEVLTGKKWVTRRVCKPTETYTLPGSYLHIPATDGHYYGIVQAVHVNGRRKWELGRQYALQPGRGKPQLVLSGHGPVWLKINYITREHLHSMQHTDFMAEGYYGQEEEFHRVWDSLNRRRGHRWEDNPDVWRIRFDVVYEAEVTRQPGEVLVFDDYHTILTKLTPQQHAALYTNHPLPSGS